MHSGQKIFCSSRFSLHTGDFFLSAPSLQKRVKLRFNFSVVFFAKIRLLPYYIGDRFSRQKPCPYFGYFS